MLNKTKLHFKFRFVGARVQAWLRALGLMEICRVGQHRGGRWQGGRPWKHSTEWVYYILRFLVRRGNFKDTGTNILKMRRYKKINYEGLQY